MTLSPMLFRRRRECQACGELREELAKAQNRLNALVLDWETLQDKVHRWMQRTSARARTEEREVLQAQPPGQLGAGAAAESQPAAPLLDPVSAKLMARRARRPLVQASASTLPTNGEEGG